MEQDSEVPIWSMSTEELFHRNFPVHQACRNGDLESLSALLSSGNVDFYEEDSFTGWSPLHWAANFGKLSCLIKLVQMGACCDVPTERTNITPAHTAADGGKGHCLSWLLENHALMNRQLACLRKLSSLSQYGCDNPSSKFQQSPLHLASCAGHPHCTQWLIQSGANLDRQDYLGDTPIHKAAKKGNMECVSLLISQGANLCLLNHSHCTPSQAAAEHGYLECAQYIENVAKLQAQREDNTRQHCVTMQPSHLLQSQMEQDMSSVPFQNGHCRDGFSPVVHDMDMSGDGLVIGGKRSRDDNCDEESFKRMRKGVQAQNELDTDLNNVIVSYQAILALSTEPLKYCLAFRNPEVNNASFVNNNTYFPHLNGTSMEEHEKTVCIQQGYDSLFIHSVISDFHGS